MRRIVASLAVAVAVSSGTAAFAQDYPDRPIEMYISAGAGGSTDAGGRILAKSLEETLGTSIVVVNKPGGAGSRALADLLEQPADGYTIAYVYSPHVSFSPQFRRDEVPYTAADFDYIGSVTNPRYSIVGLADQGWSNLDELIASLKEKDAPLRFVYSAGPGRLVAEAIGEAYGTPVQIVRADSGGKSMQMILGGHVDVGFSGGRHAQYTDSGDMLVLATADAERDPNFPEAKTLQEYGVEATAPARQIVVAPMGIPEEAKTALTDAVKKAKANPEIRELYESNLSMPIDTLEPEQMDAYMADEEEKYRSLITSFDK